MTRHEGIRFAVWNNIDMQIDRAPRDGMNAEGEYNDRVADVQRAYINGMRAARLAAMKIIDALDPSNQPK